MDERRNLAGEKKIWIIKAAFPDKPSGKFWSDYAFAYTMKKYLERLGCYVIVQSRDEWNDNEAADVVVSLRGPIRYYPDRSNTDCIYILWNLSHPDEVAEAEYDDYDLVCVGSEKKDYISSVRQQTKSPVRLVPMCVDTEIFYPVEEVSDEKEYDWIFVGNSRNKFRNCVTWAIENNIPLKIWGVNWKKFIPDSDKYVVAENIPNSELPDLYRNAKVTIDDHHEDMIRNGFINTRILEAFACGLPVISDYSEVLYEMFGDAILCYRNKDEFVEQTEKIIENYDEIKEKVKAQWPLIREKYSFTTCIGTLYEYAGEIREYAKQCENVIKELESGRCVSETGESDITHFYKNFYSFLGKISDCENDKDHFDILKAELLELQNQFVRLDYQEQRAFECLQGRAKFYFEAYIQPRMDVFREQQRIDQLLEKIEKMNDDLTRINTKLQKTYKEKSEINRKLQITYGEKRERGITIKKLEKKLDGIKKSRTYRMARVLGFPVRCLRKLIRKIKSE